MLDPLSVPEKHWSIGYGQAYEVEFCDAGGRTLAVLTLTAADVRPRRDREILHVRELA